MKYAACNVIWQNSPPSLCCIFTPDKCSDNLHYFLHFHYIKKLEYFNLMIRIIMKLHDLVSLILQSISLVLSQIQHTCYSVTNMLIYTRNFTSLIAEALFVLERKRCEWVAVLMLCRNEISRWRAVTGLLEHCARCKVKRACQGAVSCLTFSHLWSWSCLVWPGTSSKKIT